MPSLAECPLPRLLLGFARDGFDGTMRLRFGRVDRSFRWQAGRPVEMCSERPEDALSAFLVARGTIEAATAERVRSSTIARDKGELAALAASQAAPPKELLLGYAEQIRAGLIDAFAWGPDAEVQFELAARDGTAPALPIEVAEVVRAGMTRHWRPDQCFAALSDQLAAFPTAAAAEDAPQPDESAAALLARCDGAHSAFSLLRQDADAAAIATLWWLDATGHLRWSETAAERLEDEPAAEDDAAASVEIDPAELGPEIEIVLSEAGSDDARAAAKRGAGGEKTVIDPKAEKLRAEILDLHERLADITYYELLGVERDAKPNEVKKGYLKAAKRLHPDALSRLGLDDIKDAANGVFAEITKAHGTLSDLRARQSYDAVLEGHTAIDADQLAQAEMLFRKGEILMKAGNFLDAFELLDAAVSLWPEEAEYHAALAWALQRKTPPESARAVEHFEKAIELGNPTAQWLLRMSYAVKECGDTKRAAQLASDAKQLDPQVRA